MPRKARILVSNYPHHVVQRGHNRKAVFVADADYQYYLDNLCEWKKKLNIKLYAWCLMTNHVHLIVEPGDRSMDLSELMKRLAGRQTAYVNKLEKRTGSLWEGRYKASPIQRDEYLLACCRYVEMNPVRASMVAGPRQYKWSSYQERMGLVKARMLDYDATFIGLADENNRRLNMYKSFLQTDVSDKEIEFLSNAWKRNQLTGSKRFVEEIEERTGLRIESRERGRPGS